jgi:hypothetical protein
MYKLQLILTWDSGKGVGSKAKFDHNVWQRKVLEYITMQKQDNVTWWCIMFFSIEMDGDGWKVNIHKGTSSIEW